MFAASLALSAALLAPHLPLALAYTWKFTSVPKQCGDFNVSIEGTGGKPPYTGLIIPYGPSPIANEVRRVQSIPFNDSSSLSFKIRFPSNSQFVFVVSDANGFGTGGASAPNSVQSSNDDSCYDSSKEVAPAFYIHLQPENLAQCAPTRIWWDHSAVQSTPSFVGVIPGGNAFSIPNGTITQVPEFGDGFDWTPSVRVGNAVIVVGGDSRGLGSAGSANLFIQTGNNNSTCINDASPSSTAGTPAGGSYPTNTSGSGSGGGKKSNTGAIVGGVIGGIAGLVALLLVALFCYRRRRFHKTQKERPVDLLNEADEDEAANRQELPQYYQPDPFTLPEPTVAGTTARDSSDAGAADYLLGGAGAAAGGPGSVRPSTPSEAGGRGFGGASTTTRKSAHGPTPLRPVNIIQHEDGRRVDEETGADENETIELPPAYTHIKRDPSKRISAAARSAATGRTSQETEPVASGSGTTTGGVAPPAPAEESPAPNPPASTAAAA